FHETACPKLFGLAWSDDADDSYCSQNRERESTIDESTGRVFDTEGVMREQHRPTMQTAFRIRQQTLIVDLGAVRSVLSSAPMAGGVARARYILNHQVAAEPIGKADRGRGAGARNADPAR